MSQAASSVSKRIKHRGHSVPTFVYGTAWKEERTEALTRRALEAGFTGIDTANQRKHYHEAGVGEGIRQAIANGTIKREDLFLQTKFTYVAGQDHRLPYDPKADFPAQVSQSFASSLEHLHTDYLDSYVLHGPSSPYELTHADWEVWHTMEALKQTGQVRLLGVSNVRYEQLEALVEKASVLPAFVQNRCYARTHWDLRIRDLCKAYDILYQGFSLLTANLHELNHPRMQDLLRRKHCTLPQAVFRFALQVGMMPLTGTSSKQHMLEDLGAYDFELDGDDIALIENIASPG